MAFTNPDPTFASAVTVAVAADMTARILARIAGNELATTINGVSQTRDKITLMSRLS